MIETHASFHTLQRMLLGARARTLALVSDLTGAQLMGPKLGIVNPPLWEIGHLAWFQERWCLRHVPGKSALLPSILPEADTLYDSATVAHATRWDLPLLAFDATLDYLRRVLEHVLERLDRDPTATIAYFAQLAALHEEMHCEAFTYTRQTLGYPAPVEHCTDVPTLAFATVKSNVELLRRQLGTAVKRSAELPGRLLGTDMKGDVELPGGRCMLGATPRESFVFDNEKWAHEVLVESFSIARACVTHSDFLAFVEDGGYVRRDLWSDEGWRWRESERATQPVYWRKVDGDWQTRLFDTWRPIPLTAAMVHVNWFEASAYCNWAGRRLPSEIEWEYAAAGGLEHGAPKRRYPWGDEAPNNARANLFGAAGDVVDVRAYAEGDSACGCRQMIGNVWEWSADTFQPYPGFVVDPYREYSQPWFGTHKVLRGGSHATRSSLIRNTWRNFFTPERRDIYAGFRTCA